MCKYLVLLLFSFEGEVIKEKLEFTRPINVYECMEVGSEHREQISTYDDKINAWILNDGRGTFQGFICK
tara:strand:+ start:627 stop:833 length:207 start_codon:yes stop_codon:yes gene_type:complete